MSIFSEISAAIGRELTPLGFEKRALGIFTNQPALGFLGWLGLNRASPQPGIVEINPVIGVRCQELEEVISDLSEGKPHPYLPPTISIPLGYLMPEDRYHAWLFERGVDVAPLTVDLLKSFRIHGLPFIQGQTSLASIRIALASRKFSTPEHTARRLPAVDMLLGRYKEASVETAKQLTALADRSDRAAKQQQVFLERLQHRINDQTQSRGSH